MSGRQGGGQRSGDWLPDVLCPRWGRPIVATPKRVRAHATRIAARSGLSRTELLSWAVAHTALSGAWLIEHGMAPAHQVRMIGLLLAELGGGRRDGGLPASFRVKTRPRPDRREVGAGLGAGGAEGSGAGEGAGVRSRGRALAISAGTEAGPRKRGSELIRSGWPHRIAAAAEIYGNFTSSTAFSLSMPMIFKANFS